MIGVIIATITALVLSTILVIVDNKLNHLPDWFNRQFKRFEGYLENYLK